MNGLARMLDANTAHISLLIEGASTDLQVLSFKGREALNEPFCFDLELVSTNPGLALEELLHKPALLTFSSSSQGKIHGQVYSIGQGETGRRLTRYHISLRPQLAYLAHRVNQRIFQQMTVPQIIAQVLEEHGIQSDAYPYVRIDADCFKSAQLGVTACA
jgi:type VI secretion system secreted protein VgrG